MWRDDHRARGVAWPEHRPPARAQPNPTTSPRPPPYISFIKGGCAALYRVPSFRGIQSSSRFLGCAWILLLLDSFPVPFSFRRFARSARVVDRWRFPGIALALALA